MVREEIYSRKISVRLTQPYYEKLVKLSEITGKTVSYLIREAIDYLEKEAKDRGLIP